VCKCTNQTPQSAHTLPQQQYNMGGRQSSQGVSGRHHESPNNQGSSRYSTASLDNASLVARPSGSIDFSSDRPVSRRRRRRDRNDQFIEAHSLPSHLFPFVTGMFCFLFLLFVFQCHAHVNTYYVCLNLQSSRKMIVANSKIPASPVSVLLSSHCFWMLTPRSKTLTWSDG